MNVFDFIPFVKNAFKKGEDYGFECGFRIGLRLGRELQQGNTVIIGDRESIKKMLASEDEATIDEVDRILRKQ